MPSRSSTSPGAILTARVSELEEQDPAAADRLRERRREFLDHWERLGGLARDTVEDVIAFWGARVRDEVPFRAEFWPWRKGIRPAPPGAEREHFSE
ncbi:hypothetical protein [Ensifer aridi]|uniref:hypothetical protein n=1 Tax=Ensifer aridi TaxID=1708715 RepID=UPI0015E2CB7F|nr:hypothetical protein [Ensifer aridi]